jgi:multidrug efflux pump subunit AcrA (membrane-fusion protein)
MSNNTSKIIVTIITLGASLGGYHYYDSMQKKSHQYSTENLDTKSDISPIKDIQVSLKSVNPKKGGSDILLVEQPATIEPYYRATLYSDITGRIRFFEKDLGQSVKKNEIIAIIDPAKGVSSGPFNVVSPFDGVISARTTDPGDFVSNAGLVPGSPSIAVIERTDIVTIAADLPDGLIPLINKNTNVDLVFDNLPGGKLTTTISRIAPSINVADRTIKVEVDIYNRTKLDFDNLAAQEKKNSFQDFKGRELPIFPQGLPANAQANLIPGNYGRMRVTAKPAETSMLLPTSAIFRSGGLAYVYKIENGIVKAKKIKVIIDDGNLVQVAYLIKDNGIEIATPILASDEIAISNQNELQDGETVISTKTDW